MTMTDQIKISRNEFQEILSNTLTLLLDRSDYFINEFVAEIDKRLEFLRLMQQHNNSIIDNKNDITVKDIVEYKKNINAFSQNKDIFSADIEVFHIRYDALNIPEHIKIDRSRILPVNLPFRKTKMDTLSEWVYHLYCSKIYPIEKFIIGNTVNFTLSKTFEYHINQNLNTLFETKRDELLYLQSKTYSLITESIDVALYTCEEIIETTGNSLTLHQIDMLKQGLLRASKTVNSPIAEFKSIKENINDEIREAVFSIDRYIFDEMLLAGTSVELLIREFRRLSKFFAVRIVFDKILKTVKNLYLDIKNRFTKKMPAVFNQIERTIKFSENSTSFIRDISYDERYPNDLAKIFTSDAVRPPMFYGRNEELQIFADEYKNFRAGHKCSLALHGACGVGKRSPLLNATKDWEDVYEIDFSDRYRFQGDFRIYLAALLGISSDDDLIDYMNSHSRRIIILKNIEFLYDRKVNAFDNIQYLMRVIAHTQSKIMWVVLTNDLAFDFLDGAFKISRLFRNVISLQPLSRKTMEDMILHRLHFSGYRILYAPSDDDDQKQKKNREQKVLHSHFFDRLYDTTKGYPLSALFFTGKSMTILPENNIILRTLPKVRFDALSKGTLNEKLLFCKILELNGIHRDDNQESQSLISIAITLGILRLDDDRYKITPELEPLVRQILSENGIITKTRII